MTTRDSVKRPPLTSFKSNVSRTKAGLSRRRKIIVSLGGLASLLLVVLILAASFEWPTNLLMAPLIENESVVKSDVIIVLGAGSRSSAPHVPPQADARVQKGVTLLQNGWAPQIIVSGGYNAHTGLTEAPLMAAAAEQDGALITSILLEPKSKNTWENATYSLALMKEHNWNTALVITSPYHTWRACHIFRKQAAHVRCIAAPLRTNASHTAYERLMDFRSVVREYGAIVYFFFKHYI